MLRDGDGRAEIRHQHSWGSGFGVRLLERLVAAEVLRSQEIAEVRMTEFYSTICKTCRRQRFAAVAEKSLERGWRVWCSRRRKSAPTRSTPICGLSRRFSCRTPTWRAGDAQQDQPIVLA